MTKPVDHILFLTSVNLASNPRCLKEVRLAVALGLHVTVVAFYMHNWAGEKEKEIVAELPDVDFHYLEATNRAFAPWVFATIVEKVCHYLSAAFPGSSFLPAMAVNKRSWLLLRWVTAWKGKPDLVVAHNPPAFYGAYKLACRNGIPFGLDIEDYHPGEKVDQRTAAALTPLMKKLLPLAAYTTYASPLIHDHCRELVGQGSRPEVVVNNNFPSNAFTRPSAQAEGKMRLVWFSQNIGAGRGLEEMIPSMQEFADRIELTLIGDPKQPFCQKLISSRPFIRILPPLSQSGLYKAIGEFDIGLATEPGKDLNNKIALSNKIWTYFQSGLFILASNTPAQSRFMSEHPGHGICIALDRQNISDALGDLTGRLNEIRSAKAARFEQAKQFGWEKESLGLLNVWQEVLQNA